MLIQRIFQLRHRLVFRLILAVGFTLLVCIATWAYFNIDYQESKLTENIVVGTDRLTTTIKLGTHYAMMLNSRDDINQIIRNIGKLKEIQNIRIYNKHGQIKYSNRRAEVDTTTNIKAEACDICHRTEPPLEELGLQERTRLFDSDKGYRLLGIISPIFNEPGCATDACHVHPEGKKVLGALDVVVSLQETDREILLAQKGMIGLAGFAFLLISSIVGVLVFRFVNRPVQQLIEGTRQIARGAYPEKIPIGRKDEMGQLATAIGAMSREIAQKQAELNEQRNEYQNLFEHVPCLITVQDRTFKLLRYNQEFAERFGPGPGDHCYQAYKGRGEKCPNCQVALTFEDGMPHQGEEAGLNKDGSEAHWIFRTSPIRNAQGEIVAALEMSLDITERKLLEVQLSKSERKYHEIFNHIPNPVFVLDSHTLEIIDCNESVKTVYGYDKDEIVGRSFLMFFAEDEREGYAEQLHKTDVLNQVRHRNKAGGQLFVNVRVSPSEYPGRQVLLVTTSDITKRLEAERKLIQASKMATLGEMATGVAHELNQPMSVIKTASSFFIKKLERNELIQDDILHPMLKKIDSNVDRATRIIEHMRQFARKSDLRLEKVQLNEILGKAFEIFSQQLRVRGIEVLWDLEPDIPRILADPSRLEQVFINLLLNARDAIEEKWEGQDAAPGSKIITLKTRYDGQQVSCEVRDTGKGIPPILAEKIFEPFFTTKEVGKGTGLGLSISYGIIQECGGTIRLHRDSARGACFVLEFPVTGQQHETADSHRR